jgi:hypothetical protein
MIAARMPSAFLFKRPSRNVNDQLSIPIACHVNVKASFDIAESELTQIQSINQPNKRDSLVWRRMVRTGHKSAHGTQKRAGAAALRLSTLVSCDAVLAEHERAGEAPRRHAWVVQCSAIKAQVITSIARSKLWLQTRILGIRASLHSRSRQVTSSAASLLSLVWAPVPTRSSDTPCVWIIAGSTERHLSSNNAATQRRTISNMRARC